MFSSLTQATALTALFALTGLHSLVRLLVPDPGGGDRTAALSHLLMSVAMVGMTWGWPAGPDTAGGAAQLVVFGLLAVVFVVRVLDPALHPSAGSVQELLMLGAMLWMVLAMPASHGHHAPAGHAVTQLVTVAFVVLLCATAFARVSRRVPALVGVAAAQQGDSEPCADSRLDVAAHVLMSGGMAAMLLAMI